MENRVESDGGYGKDLHQIYLLDAKRDNGPPIREFYCWEKKVAIQYFSKIIHNYIKQNGTDNVSAFKLFDGDNNLIATLAIEQ